MKLLFSSSTTSPMWKRCSASIFRLKCARAVRDGLRRLGTQAMRAYRRPRRGTLILDLRHQYAWNDRPRIAAARQGNAARPADHHDHRLWRPATLRRAKEAGADGVFGKPIDFVALKAEIDQRLIARGLPA